ncbi:MAG: efflux RND transporter permease subunit [bacterium]|nr:efflux RND transporter permease subunit [bacterium]
MGIRAESVGSRYCRFIALFGIALENGLVLVGCFNQLLEEGLSIEEASIKGACLRLRAVLMTAFTTLPRINTDIVFS